MPREDAGRRRINAAVLTTIVAALMVLAFTMILIPQLDRKRAAAYGPYHVTVLRQGMPVQNVADTVNVHYSGSDGRAQRMTLVMEDGKTIEPATPDDYRRATGESAQYSAVIAKGSPYAGQLLRIDGATVMTVPGDKIFSIGPTELDSILVKMDEPTNPGYQGEHELVIRPGDNVWVVGSIEPMPDETTLKSWGLTDDERIAIGRQDVYLRARLVQDETS